jgi:NAD(P)-dependent dehydrogenase (short-subunit alcohol dehydrogenase family)
MEWHQVEPALRSQKLAGKVAIVTGTASRDAGICIGMAIANLFAREGAKSTWEIPAEGPNRKLPHLIEAA